MAWTARPKTAMLRAFPECIYRKNALVAQLDRVSVSEAEGRGFDSRRAHQIQTYGHVAKGQENLVQIRRDQSVTNS